MAADEAADEVTRLKADGSRTLAEIAEALFHDRRLGALLEDMNPGLSAQGRVAAGRIVLCPNVAAAKAFAKKMGFSIGFNPEGPNGTRARRLWQKQAGMTPAPRVEAPEPNDLARRLLAAGHSPNEAGRRVARAAGPSAPTRLGADPKLAAVAASAERHALLPPATRALQTTLAIADATLRPGGLRLLLSHLREKPDESANALALFGVTQDLISALAARAPAACSAIEEAEELARFGRDVAEARLRQAKPSPQLRALVEAALDGADVLGPERIDVLGLTAEAAALNQHLERLVAALKEALRALPRADVAVLRAFTGQPSATASLRRPWSTIVPLCLRVVAQAPPPSRLGGGLAEMGTRVVSPQQAAPPVEVIGVQELGARAALGAAERDAGVAVCARLAPVVIALFGVIAPSARSARSAARRAAFDRLVSAGATSQEHLPLAAGFVREAREAGMGTSRRSVEVDASIAADIEARLTGQLSYARRQVSSGGRALLAAAYVLDDELSRPLGRVTSREHAAETTRRHGGQILSVAAARL